MLNGVIPQFDISNIQLAYPGLTFNSAVASSIGFDFSAFVDCTTGAFIYHDVGQGLAVIAFAVTDINSAVTFLSITVDNPNPNFTGVADQFNALNNGNPMPAIPPPDIGPRPFPRSPPHRSQPHSRSSPPASAQWVCLAGARSGKLPLL